MTNEEWKRYNDLKHELQEERECSKIIENALRYRAFTSYTNGGCRVAVATLNRDCKNNLILKRLSVKAIGRIKRGITAELLFYTLFGNAFSLTPTLDAGCAFDFVGKIPLDENARSKQFARIDVTRSIEAKRKYEPTTCYGQINWAYRIAHVCVKRKCIDWYDEGMSEPLFKVPFTQKCLSQKRGVVIKQKTNLLFQKIRREVMEKIEHAHSLGAALAAIRADSHLSTNERSQLEAEAIFFATYKYALNIVPALSCGDLCDFIGEHDGVLVKYRVLTDKERYYNEERPILEQLSQRFKYKVALFDSSTKMFAFHDWNEWQLLDDVIDFDDNKASSQQK